MLEDHPEINVLTTFNEWTTLGVGYAIREAGAASRIRLVAFDSNVVSVDMLETGEVDALVVQHRLSGRRDRLPASERAEAPLPGDRYLHHVGNERKHVYRRISAHPFLLR